MKRRDAILKAMFENKKLTKEAYENALDFDYQKTQWKYYKK